MPAQGMEEAHVGEFAQGAVGLGGVPLDGAAVTYGGLDEFGELTDGYLLAAADVDVAVAHLVALATHILPIDVFQTIDAGVCHVLAPQEFPYRGSTTPQPESIRQDAIFFKCFQYLLLDGVPVV